VTEPPGTPAAQTGAERSAEAPADRQPRPPSRAAAVALAVAAVLVATFGAALTAVLSAFLVPLRIGTVAVPLSVLIVIVGNAAAVRFAYRATGRKLAMAAPAMGWLVTTMPFTVRRAEGDLVISDGWTGLAVLFCGSLALAVSAYLVIVAPPAAATPPEGRPVPDRALSANGPGRTRDS
jgi:hypothetical protein